MDTIVNYPNFEYDCYEEYNDDCLRDDVEIRKVNQPYDWRGEGRSMVLWPDSRYCSSADDFKRAKDLGFDRFLIGIDQFAESGLHPTEVFLNGAPQYYELDPFSPPDPNKNPKATTEGVNKWKERLKKEIDIIRGKPFRGDPAVIYLDEPEKWCDDEQIWPVSELHKMIGDNGPERHVRNHVIGIPLMVGSWETFFGFWPIGIHHFDGHLNRYTDGYCDLLAYTGYTGSFTLHQLEPYTEKDQTGNWDNAKNRYWNFYLPWIKLDRTDVDSEEDDCDISRPSDIDRLSFYLGPKGADITRFQSVGAYSLEIFEEVAASIHNICSELRGALPPPKERDMRERLGDDNFLKEHMLKHAYYVDRELYDFLKSCKTNDTNWEALKYCFLVRTFKCGSYFGYMSETDKCTENLRYPIYVVFHNIYWKRLQAFSDAARDTGWVHAEGSRRYYAQTRSCKLAAGKSIHDIFYLHSESRGEGNANIIRKYWGATPLMVCPEEKMKYPVEIGRTDRILSKVSDDNVTNRIIVDDNLFIVAKRYCR
jgi:hypothetical protein